MRRILRGREEKRGYKGRVRGRGKVCEGEIKKRSREVEREKGQRGRRREM